MWADWDNHQNPEFSIEQFQTDALGNVYWRRSGSAGSWTGAAPYATAYAPGIGHVTAIHRLAPSSPFQPQYADSTGRSYDPSGNVDSGGNEVSSTASDGTRSVSRYSRSRSFYDAEERLRYHQEQVLVSSGTAFERLGVWEEYRYDGLGRRVLVRSNRDDLCNQPDECFSHVTRYVWSGDQVLWELRAPGGNSAGLDAEAGSGPQYGRVSYFHAGGIDRPLVIMKNDTSIIPHQNFRGQFAFGTYGNGQVSDCGGGRTPCSNVPWPGFRTTAWHVEAAQPDIRTWYGGLVDGMRDASGQMYMRNRYYDPKTGQFTQTDPIGLAGGLNAYGFAAGDPVTYNDPYGLCADHQFRKHGLLGGLGIGRATCPGGLSRPQYRAVESAAGLLSAEAGGRITGMLESGAIRRVRRTGNGEHAGAAWQGPDRIQVTDGFFRNNEGYKTDGERAWVLGHELGHLVQAETGGLLTSRRYTV